MTGQTERVILIKGDGTKWYNQAIFIVNQDAPKDKIPVNFVAEAEKIINNYMNKNTPHLAVGGGNLATAPVVVSPLAKPPQRPVTKKKSNKFDFVLNTLMMLACMTIVAVLVYGWLG